MRRTSLILGLVLIAGLIVHDVYQFFVTNEGIQYFSARPSRLLYVLLLGIAGGVVALGINRLSPASRHRLKLMAAGGFGSLLVAALIFFGHLLYLLASSPPIETQLWGWIVAAFCSVAVAGVLVWIEFLKVWRQPR